MFDPIETIKEYVSYPSVSTDSDYKEGMEGARQFISKRISDMGFTIESIPTALHPIILAERKGDPSWPHVIIYGHYDVQPADPVNLWNSHPFEPMIREGRLYGRGAADNKGPQLVHITAVASLLEEYPDLPLNITFLIEGEEEIGSPSFNAFLHQYRQRLKADWVMLSDTISPSKDQIAITTGLRGIVCLEATLKGPRTDLHSGIHGGILLNPVQALTELCASLHTPEGAVNIDGFYEDVIYVQEWERKEIAKLCQNTDAYAQFLGINAFHIPGNLSPFEALRLSPTLEFNGISGGYQGEGSKTIIPSQASVKISCRLVPAMDPLKIQTLLSQALQDRCSSKVSIEIKTAHEGIPYHIAPPNRVVTETNQQPRLKQAFLAAEKAIQEVFGQKPLFLREGGSVPIIGLIKQTLNLDSLMIGMFTPEDNLHAPNESMDLGMFCKGVDVSKKIISAAAGVEA